MEDKLIYDPTSQEETVELIPEGLQLFTIYNLWFGNYNENPKGAKRRTDFSIPIRFKFEHVKTGLFLNRLANGQRAPFNSMLFLKKIGNIDTRQSYYKFMRDIGAPVYKTKTGGEYFHTMKDGKRVFTAYDEEPKGPIGLPVKLMVIHKEVPVLKAKEGAEKNRWGRYEDSDLIEVIGEDGKPKTKIQEFIKCTEPESDNFEDVVKAGWPVVYELGDDEVDVRGEYFKPEEEDNDMNITADEIPEENVTF